MSNGLFLQGIALSVILLVIPMLIAGNGSLFYFSSKIPLSPQTVDEFNKRLPNILRRIYGLSGEESIPANRRRFSGFFQMSVGSSITAIFILGQIRDMFRQGDLVQDIIVVIFVILEISMLVYFLNFGRVLVSIERSKDNSTPNSTS